MRAKGTLLALLAGGLLILAPGFDGARADGRTSHQHWQSHGHGKTVKVNSNHRWYGHDQWWGQHKRSKPAYKLSKRDRKKLKRMRHRFKSERAFRKHLRHKKPRLYARYMAQFQPRHRYYDGRNHWRNHHRHSYRYGQRQQRIRRGDINRNFRGQWYALPPQGRIGN